MKDWLGIRRFVRTARAFREELVPFRGSFVRVALLSCAAIAMELARPWPIKWILDGALVPWGAGEVTGAAARDVVLTGAVVALVLALGFAGTSYLRTVGLAEIGHGFSRSLRARLFGHLTELGPDFHTRNKSGDILVRLMGDVPLVRSMLVDSCVELSTRSLLVVGSVVLVLTLDPFLGIVVLGAGPLVALSARFIARHLTVAVRKQRRKEGALADYLHEAIAGNEVLHALGGNRHVVRRFKRSNRRSERAGLKATRLAAALSSSVEAQLGVALALTLGLGSWRVLAGALSPGELIVFMSYVRGLLRPVRSAARHAQRLSRGTAGAERVLEVLDCAPSVTERSDAIEPPRRPRRLAWCGVHFAHAGGPAVLRGVDLEIERGKLVALVGANGAGKSTMAMLSARLADPEQGSIELDGEPLTRFRLEPLRRCVALVLQAPTLFGESLRENLLLASPEADDAELVRALESAGALSIVAALGRAAVERGEAEADTPAVEAGLDARLGAAGRGLSGGQMRRICLARALLADPDVLVVDEPFAGLDATALRETFALLRRLADERIVLVIAHDVVDLSVFDSVALLEDGRIVAHGAHTTLCRERPSYGAVLRGGER